MLRVRAVIIKNEKVLTLERNKDDDHFWCFPGGGLEEGESEQEALERECLEEANVMVKVGIKIYHQDFEGYGINFYLCEIISGKVGKGNGPEYQKRTDYLGTHQPVWLPIKDLQKYDLRPNELRDKIIKEFLHINYQKALLKDINEITELLTKFEGDRKDISANQFMLAKDSDRLIGCIRIKELDKGCLELASLVVTPEYRKQGIGSQLVKAILSKEKRRPIYLLCSAQQQGFYERNGFGLIDTGVLPEVLKKEYQCITKLPFALNIKVIVMKHS